MKGPSIAQLGEMMGHFFRRYHVILFSLTIVISVSAAVMMLNNLLVISGASTGSETNIQASGFDQKTIDKIENFTTASDSPRPFSLPAGRVNPLVE